MHNWRRLDPAGPIALENLVNLLGVHGSTDETWFLTGAVTIEACGSEEPARIVRATIAAEEGDADTVASELERADPDDRQDHRLDRADPRGLRPVHLLSAGAPPVLGLVRARGDLRGDRSGGATRPRRGERRPEPPHPVFRCRAFHRTPGRGQVPAPRDAPLHEPGAPALRGRRGEERRHPPAGRRGDQPGGHRCLRRGAGRRSPSFDGSTWRSSPTTSRAKPIRERRPAGPEERISGAFSGGRSRESEQARLKGRVG